MPRSRSRSPPPRRPRSRDRDRGDDRKRDRRPDFPPPRRDFDRERESGRRRERDYPRDDRHRASNLDRDRDRERRSRYDGDGPTRDLNDRRNDNRARDRSPRRSPARGDDRALVRRSHSRSRSRSKEEDKGPSLEPNFKPSGLLAAATKTVHHADGTSTVLKYHEPPEARKPIQGWRLYVFKGSEQQDLLHIHRQSAYLIGRDHGVVDIPLDHPSCSKQHAAIQYRAVNIQNEWGEKKTEVKPFIIDLESTNGTKVNDETIPPSRYYELKQSDIIKFGLSVKEYVLLHDDAV